MINAVVIPLIVNKYNNNSEKDGSIDPAPFRRIKIRSYAFKTLLIRNHFSSEINRMNFNHIEKGSIF